MSRESGILPGILKNYIGPDIETLSGHESSHCATPRNEDARSSVPEPIRDPQEQEIVSKGTIDPPSPALAWGDDQSRPQGSDKPGRPESVALEMGLHFSSPTPLQDLPSYPPA